MNRFPAPELPVHQSFPVLTRTREEMVAFAAARAIGATPAVDPCRVYDKHGTYIWFDEHAQELDLCRPCAEKLVARRSIPTDRIEVFHGGEKTDSIHSCGGCYVPIIDELDADGAEQELEHWEARGLPRNPDEWREFVLMVEGIAAVHLSRVEALVAKAPREPLIVQVEPLHVRLRRAGILKDRPVWTPRTVWELGWRTTRNGRRVYGAMAHPNLFTTGGKLERRRVRSQFAALRRRSVTR